MVLTIVGVVGLFIGDGKLPIGVLWPALALVLATHIFGGIAASRTDGASKQKALAAMISVWLALIGVIILWIASVLVYALLRLW